MKKNCSLPDGELKIMQIIWQCVVPVSRSDIEAKLDKHLAPTTILTLLARLCGKGFLRTERRGNTNLYIPLVQHKDYLAK